MRRLRLNFYRAEDAFLILKKRQWAEEDKEFTMKQEERKRNAKKKRLLRNKQRRERKEMELRSMSLPSLNNLHMPDENHSFITKNLDTLKKNFVCKGCKSQMHVGQNIYQCSDGHIICNICSTYLKVSIHSLYYWSAELALNLHSNIFLQGVCWMRETNCWTKLHNGESGFARAGHWTSLAGRQDQFDSHLRLLCMNSKE